jgi:hypothetical protein
MEWDTKERFYRHFQVSVASKFDVCLAAKFIKQRD